MVSRKVQGNPAGVKRMHPSQRLTFAASLRLGVVEIHWAGVQPLHDRQDLHRGACRNQKSAAWAIGFNEPSLAGLASLRWLDRFGTHETSDAKI